MTTLTALQSLSSLTYQIDHLNVIFKNDWYQENIDELIELLFLPIQSVVIKEKIIGADRENIRFSWENCYFVLNFEYYSQSCWIEGQDSTSTKQLTTLHLAITKQ
ncbi:DUF3630 family protein [Colwellia sp. 12G3]|uniref:DUF3630 family protein n=1 Tax=Colwellia sp. 12G3 TaxID=2058299 RepID=UPI000C33002B|nr:DUF3630 family protein [Colwellia sp. 12G3]PKI17784.1 DUF3630 domain-containing protein [Colwellia sp. 12G3]